MPKAPIYRNLDALVPVENVLAEADAALADSARTIATSGIPEVLGAALGAGMGGGAGFAALYFAGTAGLSGVGISTGLAAAGAVVGGGMAAGVFVLAAPAVLLGVGGYAVVTRRNNKKLVEKKQLLLHAAIQKRDAILVKLKENVNANAEHVDLLTALNAELRRIINGLTQDLPEKPPA
jgi:hypothetical protein